MTYACDSCGGTEPVQYNKRCSVCGRQNVAKHIHDVIITGENVGFVAEGDPDNPEGRRVASHPASGGAAESRIGADGSFHAMLSGPLEVGRMSERKVIDVLTRKLRERGNDVSIGADPRDDRGEDGILILDGERLVLQIVTAPTSPALWKELRTRNSSALMGDCEAALQVIRAAIHAKAPKAKGCVLALDLTHASALVNQRLVDDYLSKYGDPTETHGFKAVWLVGVTPRSTLELRRPSV